MESASPAQNCQTTENSSLEQNTLGEKHELVSYQVQSEPSLEQNILGEKHDLVSDQVQSEPSPEQNTLGEKNELGSDQVQSEPSLEQNTLGEKKELGSDLVQSEPCPEQNTLGEKNELVSDQVQSEPSVEQNTLGEKHELVSYQVQSEPSLEQNTLGEKNELGSDQVPREPCPEQNTLGEKQELGSDQGQSEPILEQNTLEEKHELGTDQVQSEPVATRIVGSDAHNFQTTESSRLKQNKLLEKHELDSEHAQSEPMETRIVESNVQNCQTTESSSMKQNILGEKHELGLEHVQIELKDTRIIESDAQDKCPTTESSSLDQNTLGEKHELGPEHVQSETRIVGSDSVDVERLGTPPKDAAKCSNRASCKENRVSSRPLKRKYMLRSSNSSPTVLRSRLRGPCKPPNPSISVNANVEKKKKRKKQKSKKKTFNDEFLRTRKRVRYLLHRMDYEHNLIDAYSGEGWKGKSIEKIKPEQELQRATSEILRCKLKIRDLFQHLDSSCAEGKLQQSLFDSEGQICSEDIFCAKCGSKDFSADNDIILCDGICDRGFHQMCLYPPLLKDEIPPGDEGWLCPGCDCKVDCITLLNDLQGTDLSINDNWEKVFPEAAARASGDKPDENFGFPSDDSEDYDYDPDGPELDKRVETEGSSSEESDFTSDDSGALPHDEHEQYLGLPSDDSEDDDYDPNAPDLDEKIGKESSSSDFTSDSEDSASSDGNKSSGTDVLVPSSVDGAEHLTASTKRSGIARKKKQRVNAELLSILEPDPSQENVSSVLMKRHRERLDYKKLYDETYGNLRSDSSDDEEWTDTDAPRKKGNYTIEKESIVLPKRYSQTTKSRAYTRDTQRNLKETENTPKRRTRQKLDTEGASSLAAETHKHSPGLDCTGKVATASTSRKNTRGTQMNLKEIENTPKRGACQKLHFEGSNNSVAQKHKDSPGPDSTGKISTASASRTLGKVVTQGLFESFQENEYPTRDKKENLAKELGITVRQVSKWFENARRSFRQSPNRVSWIKKASQSNDSTPTLANGKLLGPETKSVGKDGINSNGAEFQEFGRTGSVETIMKECHSEDLDRRKHMIVGESNPRESTSSNLRNQKKRKLEDQTLKNASRTKETPIKATAPDSARAGAFKKNGQNINQDVTRSQIQTRSRKAMS